MIECDNLSILIKKRETRKRSQLSVFEYVSYFQVVQRSAILKSVTLNHIYKIIFPLLFNEQYFSGSQGLNSRKPIKSSGPISHVALAPRLSQMLFILSSSLIR